MAYQLLWFILCQRYFCRRIFLAGGKKWFTPFPWVFVTKWTLLRDWSSNLITTMSQSGTLATTPQGLLPLELALAICTISMSVYFCLFLMCSCVSQFVPVYLQVNQFGYLFINVYQSIHIHIYFNLFLRSQSVDFILLCFWLQLSKLGEVQNRLTRPHRIRYNLKVSTVKMDHAHRLYLCGCFALCTNTVSILINHDEYLIIIISRW